MRSGYRLKWSDSALADLQSIMDYLLDNWSNREIQDFARKLDERLELIVRNPRFYPTVAKRENVRRSVLTKHTIIYYEINQDLVTLVRLFPTSVKLIVNCYL